MKAFTVKILQKICYSSSFLTKDLNNVKFKNFNFNDLHATIYYKANLLYNSFLNVYTSEEQPINTSPIAYKQKLNVDNLIIPILLNEYDPIQVKTVNSAIRHIFLGNYNNGSVILDNIIYSGWTGCIYDNTNKKVLLLVTQRVNPTKPKIDIIFNFDISVFLEKTKMNSFLKNLYSDIDKEGWTNVESYGFTGIQGNTKTIISTYANVWQNIPNIGYPPNISRQMELYDFKVRNDCVNKVKLMLETLLP